MLHDEQYRPLAYVCVHDPAVRTRVVDVLERAGWLALDVPTGAHLLDALSGVIDGDAAWRRPGMIVVDAYARGCAGTTIAAGLRELGIAIPTVLLAPPNAGPAIEGAPWLRIVDGASAAAVVTSLVRAPRSLSDSRPAPPCPGMIETGR